MANASNAASFMEKVKKHYFWAAIPVLLIVAFIFASMAISDIKKKFEEKKKAVEAEKQALDGIAGDSKHPNDTTIEGIQKEIEILKKSVFEAWTQMYTDQKLRNRWPRQLSREFLTLVESLKFRASIDPTKPYLLEDYSYFIGNHLPTLLKEVQRRRIQVHDYKYIDKEKRFFPIYVDEEKGVYYILVTDGESSRVKEVLLYDIKGDMTKPVTNSGERDAYINKKRVPYYREMDPWIVTPKDYMTFGLPAAGGMMGDSMGGMMGGMIGAPAGPEMAGPGAAMSGGPGMGGPGDARGAMGEGGDMMGAGMNDTKIPGDNIDPALEQLPSSVTGGAAGAGGMDPGMGGAGMAGAGMGATGKEKTYPGLPAYSERRRIVGNVDWDNPEIYSLPTWSQSGYPKSIEIWYAQESLWVYEALIRVIAETNKESADNIALAPVKAIEAMLIGQQAGASWKSVEKALGDLTGASASASGDMMMGSMSGSEDMSSSMSSMSGSASGSPDGTQQPTELTEKDILLRILYGRYLDGENKPLAAETAPPFAEFNKMPICIKVIIDQRRIPDLLVNCANCSMPIDIKHVRLCPDNLVPFGAGASGSMGMDSGMGAPGMGAPGMGAPGMGAPGMGAPGMGAPGASGGPGMGGASETGNIDIGRSEISQINGYGSDAIRVEIYGIINIFNEPNMAEFGTGKGTGDANTKMTEDTMNAPDASTKKAEGEEGTEGEEKPADNAPAPAANAPANAPAPAGNAPANAPAPAGNAPANAPAPAGNAPANAPAPAENAPANAPAPAENAPAST